MDSRFDREREVELTSEKATAAPGQEAEKKRQRKEFDAAFALRDTPQATLAEASKLLREETQNLRGKIGLCVAVFVVLFFISICIKPTYGAGFFTPGEVLEAIWLHITQLFGASQLGYMEMIEQHPAFYQVEGRFATSLATAMCGVLLAVAGSLYQMVFKNPVAAPTMLGVSNGISLGLLVLVLVFQSNALYMAGMRYLYSYVGAASVLVLVLMLTKLICGKGRSFSVFELLMVGSLFSQVCGAIVQVITDTLMTDDLYEVYVSLSEVVSTDVSAYGVAAVVAVSLITILPIFLMRYSINTISYSDLEARLIGLDANVLKVACLVLGTLMVATAQTVVGTVSMIALVVPFISRSTFGTEFKHQFWGDVLIGALVLLLCRDLTILFPFFNMPLTLGTVVSFVTLPFYVWIIATGQRGWK